MRILICIAALFCLAGRSNSMAQVSISIQANKPEIPVLGFPIVADQTVTTTQHLANGTVLRSKVLGHQYRSATGVERFEGAAAATADEPSPTTLIYILDRSKHSAVLLNTKQRTATVQKLASNASVSVKFLPLPQARGQTAKASDLVTTDLGKQSRGVMALVGRRVTGTIPAGKMGNDEPLVFTTDVWVCPQLKLLVEETEHNPFSGERVSEITNIHEEEPDPKLFDIPEGYTIREQPSMPVNLGTAPMTAEQTEMQIAHALSSTDPRLKNSVAYALANNDRRLSDAQTLAEQAVHTMEQETANVVSNGNRDQGYQESVALTSFWDTLGWVYYRQGNQLLAERYVLAAWNLKPNIEYAMHLGSIYEAQFRPRDAATIYRRALGSKLSPSSKGRFEARLTNLGQTSTEPLSMEITSTLNGLKASLSTIAGPLNVEIVLNSADSPKVSFAQGSPANTRLLTDAISSVVAHSLPDQGPEVIVRRARLECTVQQTSCMLYFITPEH